MDPIEPLSAYLGRDVDLAGLDLRFIIQKVFEKVMATDGQLAITGAMLLLTRLNKFITVDQENSLNDKVIGILYEKMPHPAKSIVYEDFRSADGSDHYGKAGSAYAYSVRTAVTDKDGLPDPKDVFSRLMQRKLVPAEDGSGKMVEYAPPNPDGLSSLVFAYGTLVIHSVFHTDRTNPLGTHVGQNSTSSYFDLSPLYGDSMTEQMSVRAPSLGRGLLSPDCFPDDRMIFLPPAAATLLVLFNRNHNYIARQLLERNERGTWIDPPPADEASRRLQDEQIFQTARLINCVHFVDIVITDYVGGIMGVQKRGGGWPGNADFFRPIEINGKTYGRGGGNLVSVEFNTLYRWHSTLSKADVDWLEHILAGALRMPVSETDKLSPADYRAADLLSRPGLNGVDPRDRTFAGLKRESDGKFKDADLANIIYDATESPAGFFRAQGSPAAIGFIDEMGIKQAREWNVCTLNEFRTWLGLEPFKNFLDWNASNEIATAAEELYGHIDKLELYPGLHAEGAENDGLARDPKAPYSLLRPNTMRNGLLFDAVALVRGDRFFTTSLTPENLTQWGYDDIQRHYPSKAFGGHIHKLLSRSLPDNFPDNSVYTWFPMSTPEFMAKNVNLPPYPDNPWDFQRPKSTSA